MRRYYKQYYSIQITAYNDSGVDWVLSSITNEYKSESFPIKRFTLKQAFDFYIELYLIPRNADYSRKFELSDIAKDRDKSGNYLRIGQYPNTKHFSVNSKMKP